MYPLVTTIIKLEALKFNCGLKLKSVLKTFPPLFIIKPQMNKHNPEIQFFSATPTVRFLVQNRSGRPVSELPHFKSSSSLNQIINRESSPPSFPSPPANLFSSCVCESRQKLWRRFTWGSLRHQCLLCRRGVLMLSHFRTRKIIYQPVNDSPIYKLFNSCTSARLDVKHCQKTHKNNGAEYFNEYSYKKRHSC